MATLLAIDTSADACSLALWQEGSVIERHEMLPRSHTQHILPLVESLLSESGCRLNTLDGIAFGRGPGSFTGLRVCASVVQGLAFAADLPCLPVSSLQALALTAATRLKLEEGDDIYCCFDARMDEVYAAHYILRDQCPVAQTAELLCSPEDMPVIHSTSIYRVGSGWRYGARSPAYGEGSDDALLPRASAVAQLGERLLNEGGAVTVAQAVPRYLRDDVAWK